MTSHIHQTLRHTLRFRKIDVLRVQRLTPHMQRIVFGGSELKGFTSASPDDHVKLFFPNAAGDIVQPVLGSNGPEYRPGRDYSPMRDYTPRHYDALSGELTVDFVLHGDGPASLWAEQAAAGQVVGAGGPRGSFVIASDYNHYVLVGDETALPAISRWLAEMPASASADVLVEIPDIHDRQSLPTPTGVNIQWLSRHGAPADTSDLLEQALQDLPVHPGDTFYWIATESGRARSIRIWLGEHRHVEKDDMKAKGYWKADNSVEDLAA